MLSENPTKRLIVKLHKRFFAYISEFPCFTSFPYKRLKTVTVISFAGPAIQSYWSCQLRNAMNRGDSVDGNVDLIRVQNV